MSTILDRLADVIESRKPANGGDPAASYTAKLFAKGDDAILKKIGEEATETVMAAKDARAGGDSGKVLYEVADLWFHTLVLLAQFDLKPAAGARRAGAPRRRFRHRGKSIPHRIKRSPCGKLHILQDS